MAFKTYWDLSEKERAALAADDVERFAATELMRLGVLQIGPLAKEPEPVTAEPPVQTYYQIEIAGQYARERLPLLFHSIDDAKAVLALDPWLAKEERLNDDWSQRRDVAHLLGTQALSPTIVLSEMCAEHDFAKARTELSKRSAIRGVPSASPDGARRHMKPPALRSPVALILAIGEEVLDQLLAGQRCPLCRGIPGGHAALCTVGIALLNPRVAEMARMAERRRLGLEGAVPR